MSAINYYSVYKPFIEDFVALKRHLGYKYINIEYPLMQFDQLAYDREETAVGISKALCEHWCIRRPNESEKTWYNRILIMRQFSSFLNTLDYPSCLPKLPKIKKSTYKPYIYTKEEIAAIFAATDQLRTSTTCYNSMVLILPALFRVLYGTGLRIGEALALSCKDIHLEEQYIVLRDTKNGTDRMVPLSDSVTYIIAEYMNCRKWFPMVRNTDLLFVHPNGDCCYNHRVYNWFRKVLYKAGIPHKGRHQGPHMHDLRHTFSVHSLAKMAEAGSDLYYSLPVLSTYLGHSSIASTDGYVRLTADMYPSIITKVNNICPYLFPEIYEEASNENS